MNIINKLKSLSTLCAVFIGMISTTSNVLSSDDFSALNFLGDGTNSVEQYFSIVPFEFIKDVSRKMDLLHRTEVKINDEIFARANEILEKARSKVDNLYSSIDTWDFIKEFSFNLAKSSDSNNRFLAPRASDILESSASYFYAVKYQELSLLFLWVTLFVSVVLFPIRSYSPKFNLTLRVLTTQFIVIVSVYAVETSLSKSILTAYYQLDAKSNDFINYCIREVLRDRLNDFHIKLGCVSVVAGCFFYTKPYSIESLSWSNDAYVIEPFVSNLDSTVRMVSFIYVFAYGIPSAVQYNPYGSEYESLLLAVSIPTIILIYELERNMTLVAETWFKWDRKDREELDGMVSMLPFDPKTVKFDKRAEMIADIVAVPVYEYTIKEQKKDK